MQTDPNWANFLYNPATDKIGLLDFGATREYKPSFVNTYFKIIDAAAHKKRDEVLEFSRDIGFLTGYESKVRYILNCFKLMKGRCKGYVPSMECDIFQRVIAFACSCFYYF
jgi:predicted unusual protein kinase regulating ubiquinone biosynthesis (AarF/ABC1/UbiB family)